MVQGGLWNFYNWYKTTWDYRASDFTPRRFMLRPSPPLSMKLPTEGFGRNRQPGPWLYADTERLWKCLHSAAYMSWCVPVPKAPYVAVYPMAQNSRLKIAPKPCIIWSLGLKFCKYESSEPWDSDSIYIGPLREYHTIT